MNHVSAGAHVPTPIPPSRSTELAKKSYRCVLLLIHAMAAISSVATVVPPAAAQQKSPVKAVARPNALQLESWRKSILRISRPKEGCFTASYPEKQWREVTCKAPPTKPYPPRHRNTASIEIVGGLGPDFSATVTGHITEAEGSVDSVSGVTSECSVPCDESTDVCPTNPNCSLPGAVSNSYSLQMNSKPFTTATCGSPGNPGCQGWEQFVYESSGTGFIQYWLENFGPAGTQCPLPRGASCVANSVSTDGWCPFQFTPTGNVYCVVNAKNGVPAPPAPITSLSSIVVTADAASGSSKDSVTVSIGGTPHSATGNNYFPDLGNQWQEVEFNIFGNGDDGQAVFNAGSTVHVRTGVTSGTTNGPGCDLAGFTGESNNLTLQTSAPTAVKGNMPALLFSQQDTTVNGVATCADATSVGDTHLTTLGGLLYDFQAAGDFVLAQIGEDFVVHARQVSGAPTWPNATVNKAVGTRMGETRVAVCTAPSRLMVDGTAKEIADGKTLSLPSGVNILHRGNVYVVVDQAGNSVRAEDNTSYLNVTVGLGRWPQQAKGILANARGSTNEIQARTGRVLMAPFAFADLYHEFADSWRLEAAQSLLAPCSEREVERGIPEKPFYATDLKPDVYQRAHAVCAAKDIQSKALLEACVLDVAVIGNDTAAKVFVGRKAPRAIAKVEVAPRRHQGESDDRKRDEK